MELRKKEGENNLALYSRFRIKVKRGGVLIEAKKRRYHHRPMNERKRKVASLYRIEKMKEMRQARKLGNL